MHQAIGKKFAQHDRGHEYRFWETRILMRSVVEYLPFVVVMFLGAILVTGALAPLP